MEKKGIHRSGCCGGGCTCTGTGTHVREISYHAGGKWACAAGEGRGRVRRYEPGMRFRSVSGGYILGLLEGGFSGYL